MKKTLLFSAFLLLCSICQVKAQAKYFRFQDGKLYNEEGFARAKDEMLLRLKDAGQSVTMSEILAEIRRTPDSVIYQVDLIIKLSESNIVNEGGFKAGNYFNKPFPMPGLKTMDGKPFSLEALKGKPVLVNFWFIKCPPCVEEMPVLNRFKQDFGDSIHFVAVTFDSKADVRAFLRNHRFEFLQITDAKDYVDSLGMTLFPRNIFIDKNGLVRRIENGVPFVQNEKGKLVMGEGKDFEGYLRELLK